jgi:hypothetical protein
MGLNLFVIFFLFVCTIQIPVIDTATAVNDFEKIWPTPLEV